MGNVHLHMKESDSDDDYSSDEEFAYDTLARDITYKRCTSKSSNTKSSPRRLEDRSAVPSRSVSIKRGDSGRERNQATRSVSGRRKPSFKASSKRPSRKSSFCKARQGNKFFLSDMEVQVKDGNIAKLVPRKSVLEKNGTSSTPTKATRKSTHKKSKRHLHIVRNDSVHIGPLRLRPPKLELTKKTSYGAAIATSHDDEEKNFDIVNEIANQSDKKAEKTKLQGRSSYNIACKESGHRLDIDTTDSKKSNFRSKSVFVNRNNNSSYLKVAEKMGDLSVTIPVTEL